MKGSTVAVVKSSLTALLRARDGLRGVTVQDQKPTKSTDVQNADGTFEAIWFGDAENDNTVEVFKAWPLHIDENVHLDVVVQVLREKSDATQAEADDRAVALLGEVFGTLALNPVLGLAMDSSFTRCEVTPLSWVHKTGRLPKGVGFGSRFELTLEVQGRITVT